MIDLSLQLSRYIRYFLMHMFLHFGHCPLYFQYDILIGIQHWQLFEAELQLR